MNSVPIRINRCTATALPIFFAAVLAPTGLDAQRQGSRARVAGGASPFERAIRLGDELDLTAGQRTQLEAIRVEMLEQRTARASALMELRSEIAAGMREPEAMRRALAEQWSGGADTRESVRDRFNEILTEDQRDDLRRMNRRAIARQRGPANRGRIDRQRGPRGGRPFDRGSRPSRSRGGRP